MTRDEAFKKIGDVQFLGRDAWLVHCLSVLGMLKLEEPKSVKQRIDEAIGEYGMVSPAFALKALDAAGLKIVEK